MTKVIWWDKHNKWRKTYRLTWHTALRKAVALQSTANVVFISIGPEIVFV